MRRLGIYTVLGAGIAVQELVEEHVAEAYKEKRAQEKIADRLRMQFLPVAEHYAGDTCEFRAYYDEDETSRGPPCGRRATQVLVWNDARVSPSCELHGLGAIDEDRRSLIRAVVEIPLSAGDRVRWSTAALLVVEARGENVLRAAAERGTVTRTIDHPGLGLEVFVRWDGTCAEPSTPSTNLDRVPLDVAVPDYDYSSLKF